MTCVPNFGVLLSSRYACTEADHAAFWMPYLIRRSNYTHSACAMRPTSSLPLSPCNCLFLHFSELPCESVTNQINASIPAQQSVSRHSSNVKCKFGHMQAICKQAMSDMSMLRQRGHFCQTSSVIETLSHLEPAFIT